MGDKVLFTTCFAQKNNREVFMDFARDSLALIWQEYAKDQDALKHCEFSRNFKVISGFMTKVTTLWDKARRVAKVGSTQKTMREKLFCYGNSGCLTFCTQNAQAHRPHLKKFLKEKTRQDVKNSNGKPGPENFLLCYSKFFSQVVAKK